MSLERVVRIARLPEMRLAYLEATVAEGVVDADVIAASAELWEQFNAWRLRSRPSLGRIDIAALGWHVVDGGTAAYRTAVPVRSDYQPTDPARSVFFPGGRFAYCYADDPDEMAEAFAAVRASLAESDYTVTSGGIEVYKFHYNLEQHPVDCGLLVTREGDGDAAYQGHAGPLPLGR